MKLSLTIKNDKGDHELNLYGESMDELVHKVIDWQNWDNRSKKIFDTYSEKKQQEKKDSGWYFFGRCQCNLCLEEECDCGN